MLHGGFSREFMVYDFLLESHFGDYLTDSCFYHRHRLARLATVLGDERVNAIYRNTSQTFNPRTEFRTFVPWRTFPKKPKH
jgi:hypothetical protein